MSRQCVFIALSNQKGGVGKSTMTVLLASYFHYVMGKRVAVVDCDYPQFSIQSLRTTSDAPLVRLFRPGAKG